MAQTCLLPLENVEKYPDPLPRWVEELGSRPLDPSRPKSEASGFQCPSPVAQASTLATRSVGLALARRPAKSESVALDPQFGDPPALSPFGSIVLATIYWAKFHLTSPGKGESGPVSSE